VRGRALVLDLNIGGSGTYGAALLRKLSRTLSRCAIPVIIWSKYLSATILFEPGGVVRLVHCDQPSFSPQHLSDDDVLRIDGYGRIQSLRSMYSGTRSFVTKLVPEPVAHLFGVLLRSGVIPPELLNPPVSSKADL
jgi:hypothetical protein